MIPEQTLDEAKTLLYVALGWLDYLAVNVNKDREVEKRVCALDEKIRLFLGQDWVEARRRLLDDEAK